MFDHINADPDVRTGGWTGDKGLEKEFPKRVQLFYIYPNFQPVPSPPQAYNRVEAYLPLFPTPNNLQKQFPTARKNYLTFPERLPCL